AALASLTVNGTLTIGNNNTNRTLTVTGDITVAVTGTISLGATAPAHKLVAGGDITNAGAINLAPGASACDVTFNGTGTQTVSGAGAYTFNLITVNQGATNANIVDMQAAITVPSPFLTITNGTYKHSSPTSITPWTTGAGATIPAHGGFWLNSAATVTTSGFNVTINGGYLRISSGTMNVGNTDATRVILNNSATTLFQMDGGVMTVTGGINSSANNAAGTFTMSGGTLTLQTIDAGPQDALLLGSATTLNWSGGTIVAAKGNSLTDDVDIRSATQNVTGGTLQLGSGASSGSTIGLINGAGGSVNVWNLVLNQSSANTVLMHSATNVLNDLTINALNTLTPNAGLAINVGGGNAAGGGNWTNSGAFTQGTSVVSLLGTASSTIGGTSATTFYQLTVNKTAAALTSRKVTLGINATVSNGLTLTNGFIDAATFTVVISSGGSVVRGGGCSADGSVNGCFVSGNLQKNFAVSAGAQTRSYEVGSATATLVAYAPVSITLATVTTAGNVVVSSTAGDHPNIGSAALDASKSANRYWTIANSGAVFGALAGNSVTVNFVAADLDAMATPLNFDVGRYNGSWTVTPPPTPTRTATSTAIAGTTITTAALPGQYAVAENGVNFGTTGSFNTFETSTAPNPGAIAGVIKTKTAGAAFGLDVVAISGGAQLSSFGANVKIELLANTGGGYGADNCPTANSVVQTIASAAIAGGRSTVNFAAVADAYRDVRVRVSYPTGAPTVVSCSTDSFAIRPSAFVNFSVTDNDAQNPGTTRTLSNVTFNGGAVVHKAGRAFTVRSDAVNAAATPAITTSYTGAPSVTLTACGGSAPCTPGFGSLTLDTTHAAGQLASNAATYNQVGSFTAQLVDTSFASIDAADGSTLAERTIQSNPISVGRFVPDHFAVAPNTPTFATACVVGGFTYVGQKFVYTAAVPVITVTAQDAANNPTTFYTGSWWRITNASLTGESYSAVTGALDATGIPGTDPAVAASGAGVGTLTFGSGTGLFFSRGGVVAPFAANVSLSINVIVADGVAATVNPAVFAGIPFSDGTAIRYGRVRLSTAVGSELVDLPVKMVAEYYNGAASGFVTNGDDACTSGVSVAFSAYTKNLSPGETCVRDSGSPGASGAGCAAAAPVGQRYQEPPVLGDFNLRLAAPGAGNNGSVKITATVPTWLKYDWDAGTPGDENPTGAATFGVFGGESKQIYTREIY
ncbi:MAG TPA: DUF6701 domain-containing protein, partial [Gammaproteobacteria bacterium]|nr:DUF6701 domain-containing protein [Gammaproteobacteria bacterium]